MNFKQVAMSALTCTALLTGAAKADTPLGYTENGKALFRIDIPDFWTTRIGGPRTLTPPGEDNPRDVARVIGLSPEGGDGVWVGFIVPYGVRNLDEGVEYLREVGPHIVRDSELSEYRKRKIGGRNALTFTGKGRRDGRQVQFTAALIDLPGGRVAFSITVLESGFNASVLEDVNDIYASFRAIGQGG